ncbi:serine hydrolase domain-containing protein [Streptomyces sp. ME01-18h]|uniref:serine hydrolase domain-containing protein n=1 Tax=Streptomyces sp. ME01-18h TaxID=462920 RepID=UPI0029A6084F|nr:serine hydrolase domain-containing protein [Streptomyces sp. ME01-18h]MDX3401043.1 serine hydrolase [Streptomyces sp. ME01-18h]
MARLAQQAADTGSLGVIVRVDSGDGKPVGIAKQAAWTKEDHSIAAGDRFRVGSNTKTVTATLVLQQVAQHKISLDDTVEKWLPGAVKGGEAITVRMLLNHTSGLGDFLLTPQFLPSLTGQEQRTWTPQELLAITPEQDPPTEPGKTYSYSNANYEALGLIVEKATGSSLAELIEQKITKPLDMKDSYLATNAAWDTGKNSGKQHVTGYEPDAPRLNEILSATVDLPDGVGFAGPERPDDNVDTSAIDPSWSWAAGGMVSTAADWQTFLTALNSGELLPKAQMKQMRTTVDAPEEGGGYGLGLMRVDTACGTVWGHTGGLPGYSSEIYTDATGTRSVAVLTSTNFGIKEEKAATTNKALVEAATCQMLGKPQPSDSPAG